MIPLSRRPGRIALAAFAAVLLLPVVASAQTQNYPIPGVDIIVKRKPARGKPEIFKTDRTGTFVFDRLTPGDYTVSFVQAASQSRTLVNTSHSNIRNKEAPRDDGIQVWTLSVELGSDTLPEYPITITGREGRITGTVIRAKPATGRGIR